MTLEATPNYPALRRSRQLLRLLAPVVASTLLLTGIVLFLQQTQTLLETGLATWGSRVVTGLFAIVYLVGFGIAAVLAKCVLNAAGDVIDLIVDQTVAQQKLLVTLQEEIAPRLKKLLDAPATSVTTQPAAAKPPDDLTQLTTAELVSQLRLAKDAHDAVYLLDLHAELRPRLKPGKLEAVEQDVAKWLVRHLQRMLRLGKAVQAADVMGRAVASLSEVKEIKQLADALPTVRQSVGLCATCGKPWRGAEANCPGCLEAAAEKRA